MRPCCVLADDQRSVLRPEEAGTVGRRAEEAVRRDADEVRQLGAGLLQFLGDERAERRILDRAAGQVAGAHLVGGPAVVGFLGAHRADEGHVVHVPGDLRQVLADLDAGDGGGDLLEGAAVVVAGLEVEGVHLAGAAVHPQQDARAFALRVVRGGLVGQGLEPAGQGIADDAGRGQIAASRGATDAEWRTSRKLHEQSSRQRRVETVEIRRGRQAPA